MAVCTYVVGDTADAEFIQRLVIPLPAKLAANFRVLWRISNVWLAQTCTAYNKKPLQMAVCTYVVGDMADAEFRRLLSSRYQPRAKDCLQRRWPRRRVFGCQSVVQGSCLGVQRPSRCRHDQTADRVDVRGCCVGRTGLLALVRPMPERLIQWHFIGYPRMLVVDEDKPLSRQLQSTAPPADQHAQATYISQQHDRQDTLQYPSPYHSADCALTGAGIPKASCSAAKSLSKLSQTSLLTSTVFGRRTSRCTWLAACRCASPCRTSKMRQRSRGGESGWCARPTGRWTHHTLSVTSAGMTSGRIRPRGWLMPAPFGDAHTAAYTWFSASRSWFANLHQSTRFTTRSAKYVMREWPNP